MTGLLLSRNLLSGVMDIERPPYSWVIGTGAESLRTGFTVFDRKQRVRYFSRLGSKHLRGGVFVLHENRLFALQDLAGHPDLAVAAVALPLRHGAVQAASGDPVTPGVLGTIEPRVGRPQQFFGIHGAIPLRYADTDRH